MKFIFFLNILTLFFFSCTQNSDITYIKIDGSSTVFPIMEALAEEFQKDFPQYRVTIGVSGTGGGFKKFLNEEIDINNASRLIKDSEKKQAKKNNLSYERFSVAYDGISIVVHPENSWIQSLSVKQLNKLWSPQSKVKTWRDFNSQWPNKKLKLYGPGHDSGTFDYFTEVINKKSQSIRSDFTQSENDNILVKGVQGDLNSLAFFGFSYYLENKNKLKLIPISYKNKKPIYPSFKTIQQGTYKPLSRPLYIYVNKASLKRPELKSFLKFCFTKAPHILKEIGYVPLRKKQYIKQIEKI